MKRIYKDRKYNLIIRDVKVGDIILLNYNTHFEQIEEIHSISDLNYIAGFSSEIVNKTYYVLDKI